MMNNSYTKPVCITAKPTINNISEALIRVESEIASEMTIAFCTKASVALTLSAIETAIYDSWTKGRELLALLAEDAFVNQEMIESFNPIQLNSYNDLRALIKNPYANELLPYAVEVLAYQIDDLERAKKDRRGGLITRAKKQHGIYYTPYDVSRHMCKISLDAYGIEQDISKGRYADVCCGTGIYLISLLKELHERGCLNTVQEIEFFLRNQLMACDLNEITVDLCRYCLYRFILASGYCVTDAGSLVDALKTCITVKDSLRAESVNELKAFSPNCVVGNPPYVSKANRGNIYIDFINLAIDIVAENAVICLVVPISISSGQGNAYRNERGGVSNGGWNVKYEHFDRSPDALFGDDVKTRVTVLLMSRSSDQDDTKVTVTGLTRWTSSGRDAMLQRISQAGVMIDKNLTDDFVPKLDSSEEYELFMSIKDTEHTLSEMFGNCSARNEVFYPAIVYNWILTLDHIPPSYDETGSAYIPDSIKSLSFNNMDEAYYFIGVMNTVTAYWFWTVESDGFHLSRHYFNALGLGYNRMLPATRSRIAANGRLLCSNLASHPYESHNSRKTIVRYNHLPELRTVLDTDIAILAELGFDAGRARELHYWYMNYIMCGRNDANTDYMFRYLEDDVI